MMNPELIEVEWLVIQYSEDDEGNEVATVWSYHTLPELAHKAAEKAEKDDAEWLMDMVKNDPAGGWKGSTFDVTGARDWYSRED